MSVKTPQTRKIHNAISSLGHTSIRTTLRVRGMRWGAVASYAIRGSSHVAMRGCLQGWDSPFRNAPKHTHHIAKDEGMLRKTFRL